MSQDQTTTEKRAHKTQIQMLSTIYQPTRHLNYRSKCFQSFGNQPDIQITHKVYVEKHHLSTFERTTLTRKNLNAAATVDSKQSTRLSSTRDQLSAPQLM
jgi:hypothetical protein